MPIVSQAFEVDGSREHENEESHNSKGGTVEQTKSPADKLGSPPSNMEEEDQIAHDMKGDYMKDANMDGKQKPMVSATARSELAAELDGVLTTKGGTEVDPNIANGKLPECLLFPSEVPVFPNAIHQSWLNGQTTLQQAGQCIGAELEVAMLCMQKRLGKVITILVCINCRRHVLYNFEMSTLHYCYLRWRACLRINLANKLPRVGQAGVVGERFV